MGAHLVSTDRSTGTWRISCHCLANPFVCPPPSRSEIHTKSCAPMGQGRQKTVNMTGLSLQSEYPRGPPFLTMVILGGCFFLGKYSIKAGDTRATCTLVHKLTPAGLKLVMWFIPVPLCTDHRDLIFYKSGTIWHFFSFRLSWNSDGIKSWEYQNHSWKKKIWWPKR